MVLVPRPSRRAAGVAAVLTPLALLVVLGWPVPDAPPAVASAPRPYTSAPPRPSDAASAAPAVPMEAPSARPPVAMRPDEAALQRDAEGRCGSGRPVLPSWVSQTVNLVAAKGDEVAAQQRMQAELATLRPRQRALVAQLAHAGSGSPLALAAALMLGETLDAQDRSDALLSAGSTGAQLAQPASTPAASERWPRALLELADTHDSLPVLRLALSVCHTQRGSAADCAGPLVQRWATREPDNAAPWLWVAERAAARGEAQAVEEAMYRASIAARLDSHWLAPLQVLAEPAFDAAQGAAAASLQMLWTGIVMAQAGPEASRISRYCSAALVADANRAQRCDALARLLADTEGTLIGLVVGRAVGERLGWPAERLAVLDERRWAVQARTGERAAAADPLDCRGQRDLRQDLMGMALHGEVGYHLGRMAASGQSVSAVAATARAQHEALLQPFRESAAREPRAPSPTR